MATRVGKRLEQALAVESDDEFLDLLGGIDMRFNGILFEDRPEPISMFGSIWALHSDIRGGGITKYLTQVEGNGFERVLGWCRDIGASRAVDYLEAVKQSFPLSDVPTDPDRRITLVIALEEKALITGDPKPLRALDIKYADVPAELAQRMRSWVIANRDEVVQRLSRLNAPAVSPPTLLEQLESAAAQAEEFVTVRDAARDLEATTLRIAAERAGLIPWRSKADEEMLAMFASSIASLTEDQWIVIAGRYLIARDKVEEAFHAAFELSRHLNSGELVAKRSYAKRRERLLEASKSLFQLVDRLPQQVVVNGQKIGLRFSAHRAVAITSSVIRLHEWFMLTVEGRERARDAYGLFAGLAWTPGREAAGADKT